MEDQAATGQHLNLTESEAKKRFPRLVVASLGAQEEKQPKEEVSARVLSDGTHGLNVNTKTRIRDQEQ